VYQEKFGMERNESEYGGDVVEFDWRLDEKEDENALEKEKACHVWVKNLLHVILMDRGARDHKSLNEGKAIQS
jgi:hypothetical protein